MIASNKLAAWLADRGAHARSRDGTQRVADTWTAAPLFGGLYRELSSMSDPTPQAVLAAARRFFDRTDDLKALSQALIAGCRDDSFFLPPFNPLSSEVHSGLLLFDHEHVSIGFGVTGVDMLAGKKMARRSKASIGFTGQWNLFRYVRAGNALVSFWEAAPITEGFVAAEAGQCRCTGGRRIADGEELVSDGRSESFIIDHAESDIVYFQAMVRVGAAPLVTEYDSDSRALIGAASTDEASSRVQMMATLLRTMDREDAVPVLRESLASPHFYTRWHIMRELLALDAEAAYPDLERMAAGDPHPEIRAAARQTIAMFFPEKAAVASAPQQQGAAACPA